MSAGTEKAYKIQLVNVTLVFDGNNGEATKALYSKLESVGIAGAVAVNLFRACKTSGAAKRYHGGNGQGSYRSQAYERKNWSINNLVRHLAVHGRNLGIGYGWGIDAAAVAKDSPHRHVFYVDIPTGQVSFHSEARLDGPDYAGQWDGIRGASGGRICSWCAHLLSGYPVQSIEPAAPSAIAPADPVQEGLF